MSTGPHLCRFLRWKGFYGVAWRSPEELALALAASDSPFSCLRTCQSWGPDEELTAPGACGPDRACFERSPRSPDSLGPVAATHPRGDEPKLG